MNRKKSIIAFSILLIFFIGITVCDYLDTPKSYEKKEAQIVLYGEQHGLKEFYDLEFEAWKTFYHEENMRNLFVELPYYTAEFLNVWMQEDNDEILEEIYGDMEGTASHTTDYLDFFKRIKKECPETVFHGTDVGHQFNSTGARYITYLEENGLKESEQYNLAIENIAQGEEWYKRQDPVDWNWREEKMIANFIRAYDSIGNKKIMGIYGGAHIDLADESIMAGALKAHYGDTISSTYLYSELLARRSYQLGFSYVGLLFLLMLFIPNMIWAKNQPRDYELYVKKENKVLLLFERVGEMLVTVCALIFTACNPAVYTSPSGIIFPARIYYLILVLILMMLYEGYWIRYFKSEKTMKDMYRDFAGIPLAGATLPVLAFGLLAVYTGNIIMLAAVIILGIGHIGIHYNHYKEVVQNNN